MTLFNAIPTICDIIGTTTFYMNTDAKKIKVSNLKSQSLKSFLTFTISNT